MNLLDSLKNLFGFTPHPPDSQPAPTGVSARSESGLPPAAQRREQVLRFLVDKLRPYQNEPGSAPTRLRLGIAVTSPEEEALYKVALWDSQPGRFQDELSRQLADNYVKLAKNWQFDYVLSADTPSDCTFREGNLGLLVQDATMTLAPPRRARLTALAGQMEHADYVLDPALKTSFCLGRGRTTQTASGRIRTNDLVFLNDDDPGFDPQKGSGNGAVSRAHATIRYDADQQRYALLVDLGGLPGGGNKTKLLHPDNTVERADIPGMNYPLRDGDQIELGGAVTLLFELP